MLRKSALDYPNRLTRVMDSTAGRVVVSKVASAYDALNRRVAKTVGVARTRFVHGTEGVLLDFAGVTSKPRYMTLRKLNKLSRKIDSNTS